MGVKFLLLDEERRFFPLVSDIFDVTGHKLMVSLDEVKAKELLNAVQFDVVLLEKKHFNFWMDMIKEGKYALPIFLIEDYEYAQKLKDMGFVDLNYILLPFNPLDLLTKAVRLSRLEKEPKTLSSLGPINTLVHLLKLNISTVMKLYNDSTACSLYIKEGEVLGSSCHISALKFLFTSGDTSIELLPYTDEEYLEELFSGSWDLFSRVVFTEETLTIPAVKETPPTLKKIDLNQPVEIRTGVFWVGVPDKKSLLQSNSYLRIYEKGDIRVLFLIHAGGPNEYARIRAKVEEIISSMEMIKAVVVMGYDPYDYMNAITMLQSNPKLQLITSFDIASILVQAGIPLPRVRLIEGLPNMKLKLATGNTISLIPIPFLPGKGSYMLYEEDTGFLFSSHLFSSFSTPEDFFLDKNPDVEDVIMYVSLNMPCSKALQRVLKVLYKLDISTVFPLYGNPIKGELLRDLIQLMQKTNVGVDMISTVNKELYIKKVSEILDDLRRDLEEGTFLNLKEELENYAYFEEHGLKDMLTFPGSFSKLLLNSMKSAGVEPSLIKKVLKELFRNELLLLPYDGFTEPF
ncbi:MAG: hypothetical protein ACK4SM_01070 [Aquificaceae bacterium]